MPLEIKVGHRYRTRSGDVVEVLSKDGWDMFPFLGKLIKSGLIFSFNPSGIWGVDPGSPFDLIEEIPADAPA